jgi:hypothetical protein
MFHVKQNELSHGSHGHDVMYGDLLAYHAPSKEVAGQCVRVFNPILQVYKEGGNLSDAALALNEMEARVYGGLAERTVMKSNILKVVKGDRGYFHYVNHQDRLMTHCFLSENDLTELRHLIRFDNDGVKAMAFNYSKFFGEGETKPCTYKQTGE